LTKIKLKSKDVLEVLGDAASNTKENLSTVLGVRLAIEAINK
jgi:hypothetical protein